MTSSFEYVDGNGDEVPFPLLNGPDIDVDIQLTVGWDQKIIALSPPTASIEGMDNSPLLQSDILMSADNAQVTYLDDVAVRKRATLLPGGYYGAVFTGVRLLNVSSDVRLNFTMTYPGGADYYLLQSLGVSPPQPFSRVGLGYTDYDPIWENSSRFEFLEAGIDDVRPVPPAATRTWKEIYEDELYSVGGTITALPDVTSQLYRGLGNTIVKADEADCSTITDTRRYEWCVEAGYRTNINNDPGPGVLITSGIQVIGKDATQMSMVWDRPPGVNEILNYESLAPVVLELKDSLGNLVISGPDSSLVPTVTATDSLGNPVVMCKVFRTSCAGPYVVNHSSLCTPSEGLKFVAGRLEWYPSMCEQVNGETYTLVFALTTTAGLTISETTDPFIVTRTVPIAVMVPATAHGSPIELPVRAIKQMVEVISRGAEYDGPISYWIGTADLQFEVHYVYTYESSQETIQHLTSTVNSKGVRQVIGPYDDQHAEEICDWIAANMPWSYSFSPNAVSSSLEDAERFFNSYRLRSSKSTDVVALVEVMAARQWNKISIVQDKSVNPLPELFYSELRKRGITVLADVNVGDETNDTSIKNLMTSIATANAKIIFSAVTGTRTTAVYTAAIELKIAATHGFQWIGHEQAHRAFDYTQIPNPEVNFAGITFLSSAYGLRPSRASWWNYQYRDESRELFESNGGMDPFYVSKRGFDFDDLSPFAQMSLKLIADAFMMTGWMHVWAITGGSSTNSQQSNWELYDSPTWSSWSANSPLELGLETHSRVAFFGALVQFKDNLTSAAAMHTASVGFNPWRLTSGVEKASADTDMTEEPIIDAVSGEAFPPPEWGQNISLTLRFYLSSEDEIEYDYVPVSHTCRAGCGGDLVNASDSAYMYDHGECIGPDTCVCILQETSGNPAFVGDACETESCDTLCQNGACTYFESSGDTVCVCDSGWSGDGCDTPLCTTYGCSSFGACALPDNCVCQDSYFGADCSQACDCGNGECNDGSAGTGECSCNVGYFGVTCASECTCQSGVCNDGAQGNGLCTSCDAGYIGDNCDTLLAAVVVPAVIGGLMLFAAIGLGVRYLLLKARKAALLMNMDWKIDYNELQFKSNDQIAKSAAFQSAAAIRFQSTTSMKGATEALNLQAIASYKNTVVYCDKIAKSQIDITPELRKEIRDVREANHPNIIKFVGACTDSPNVCILTVYAKKGSLDNIISNPDVKLDMTFKDSIMKDIARGMNYLHNGTIGCHGKLSSANCLVDGRWTVMITGFGMSSFAPDAPSAEECPDPDALAYSLFWTAPELLCDKVKK